MDFKKILEVFFIDETIHNYYLLIYKFCRSSFVKKTEWKGRAPRTWKICTILKKVIEIFFLGPWEWSLRSKTINWNDALCNKVKCNQFYRGFLPKQSISCDFLQRCLRQKPPTNDRPACPPTRRSAHWRFLESNCLWSRISIHLFIIWQGFC